MLELLEDGRERRAEDIKIALSIGLDTTRRLLNELTEAGMVAVRKGPHNARLYHRQDGQNGTEQTTLGDPDTPGHPRSAEVTQQPSGQVGVADPVPDPARPKGGAGSATVTHHASEQARSPDLAPDLAQTDTDPDSDIPF